MKRLSYPIGSVLLCFMAWPTSSWAIQATSFEVCAALLVTTEAHLPSDLAESNRETLQGLARFSEEFLPPDQPSSAELYTEPIFVTNESKPSLKIAAAENLQALQKEYRKQALSPSHHFELSGVTLRGEAAIRQFLDEYRQNLEAMVAGTNQYATEFRQKYKFHFRTSSALVGAVFLNAAYSLWTGDNFHALAGPIYGLAGFMSLFGYLPVTFSADGQLWLMRFVNSEKSKLNQFMEVLNSKDSARWVYSNRSTGIPVTFPGTPSLRPDLIKPQVGPIASYGLRKPVRGHQWMELRMDQALHYEQISPGQAEPTLYLVIRLNKPEEDETQK